ncbi:hypothetical protein E1301_Tti000104 [Triplophysa tibetana]|uniref:Uncharacterized protein n=1 Tax=Triplophysa tibetana TaxID=1572043 RepID=A0A5A9N529_9TELE|nr:hypothetical protein E1301_Tti000104 [Triplophysa tibetana]
MAEPGGSQDTLAVPPKQLLHGEHVGLNEDLVRILRENLLQQERPRCPRGGRSQSSMSPRLSPTTLSPRNSPRLLRRMLLNNNTHKQRRFTVAHTCAAVRGRISPPTSLSVRDSQETDREGMCEGITGSGRDA